MPYNCTINLLPIIAMEEFVIPKMTHGGVRDVLTLLGDKKELSGSRYWFFRLGLVKIGYFTHFYFNN